MSAFSPRKRWAVWVMIAWLATAISLWAFKLAGDSALLAPGCKPCRGKGDPCQLADKVMDLELVGAPGNAADAGDAGDASAAGQVLRAGQPEAPCVAASVRARIFADFLFIPSYSALMAFIFLLLSAPRETPHWSMAERLWAAAGIVLAVVMALADHAENRLILQLAGPPCPMDDQPLHGLWLSTATKWGTIALASALAGVLALSRGHGWKTVTALAGLLGLIAGGLLAVGVLQASKPLLGTWGPLVLFAFFLAALIHAVVVIINPDPVALKAPGEKGARS